MNPYYSDSAVRARMTEFLGGRTLQEASCVYVCQCDRFAPAPTGIRSPRELPWHWEQGMDVARSLWDRRSLLAHLDLEYVNYDFPAEAYLDPERCLDLQRPVVETVQAMLLEFGIAPLHLLSGRGHHFIWAINLDSPAFRRMAESRHIPGHLADIYRTPHSIIGEPVPLEMGNAQAGLSLVLEYLAHGVKALAAPQCRVPVELTAVAVGPVERGREMISIDISEYGDPLHMRAIRVPFSVYRKHWENGVAQDPNVARRIPRIHMIPLHEMDVREAARRMQDESAVRELARRASVRIPEESQGTERLVAAYEQSDLKRFHDWFYEQEHEPHEAWPRTYDRSPLGALPPCVRHILEHPNNRLLKPAGIELVVRTMLALGWHPRHIAGLIRSKYERDFGWGAEWYEYDAATRADFYTRVFAGLFAAGCDELVDFNCQSTKEKQLCSGQTAGCDLDCFRQSLLERRRHDRLGHRPFNRLFLSNPHP